MADPYDPDVSVLARGGGFYISADGLTAPVTGTIPDTLPVGLVSVGLVTSFDWAGFKTDSKTLKLPINAASNRVRKRAGNSDGQQATVELAYKADDFAAIMAISGLERWFTVQFPDGPDPADPTEGGSLLMLHGTISGPGFKMAARDEEVSGTMMIDVDDSSFLAADYTE